MESSSPRIARHTRKLSGQELVAAAEQLEATMRTPGWAKLVGLLDEEIAGQTTKLLGATPLSHVEYAHTTGEIRGLKALGEAVGTLLAKRDAWLEEQRIKHEGAPSAS